MAGHSWATVLVVIEPLPAREFETVFVNCQQAIARGLVAKLVELGVDARVVHEAGADAFVGVDTNVWETAGDFVRWLFDAPELARWHGFCFAPVTYGDVEEAAYVAEELDVGTWAAEQRAHERDILANS